MTKMPTFPCEGGCACGVVRYRLIEDPIEFHACHCTDCQTITGSAFVLSMIIQRRSIELVSGEPELLSYKTSSGLDRSDRKCLGCGTRLWSEAAALPDLLVLRPGTLDDTSWCEPISHIWTRSALPWVSIPEHRLNFSGQPSPEEQLASVRAWRSRAGR